MTPVHQKKQKQPRPPRKKACKRCTTSKVRCTLERPTCSRCKSLGKACEYATPSEGIAQRNADPLIPGSAVQHPVNGGLGTNSSDLSLSQFDSFLAPGRSRAVDLNHQDDAELDSTTVDLLPNDEAEFIRHRWLRPYIMPSLDGIEAPKVYNPFTLQYLGRVLATYPQRMMRDGDCPPIVHQSQVSGKRMTIALANCYTIVRMWKNAAPRSHGIVIGTVRREMERLAVEIPGQPDIESLSTFQAYLIYLLLLYFSPIHFQSPEEGKVTDQDMITLMELAFRTAKNGLTSASDVSQKRPHWASWIIAATKRRAIYVMYLFSSLYNSENGLPNFVAEELRYLPVPEGKCLWGAQTRTEWEREYELHLREWPDGVLQIHELWKCEEMGSPRSRDRIERWLRGVDDFGMMLFSVCAHIHGC
ncbi:Zn(II)2Cys6 transcription factor domain-containing protein [Aspergillus stella-maris]|uniref:Zn(II)2Cys6 transcription factor domain-containing protein n=1 Tax=Aspergillus stella-maris TaxID=1810926 RepID=UPI003CCD82B1